MIHIPTRLTWEWESAAASQPLRKYLIDERRRVQHRSPQPAALRLSLDIIDPNISRYKIRLHLFQTINSNFKYRIRDDYVSRLTSHSATAMGRCPTEPRSVYRRSSWRKRLAPEVAFASKPPGQSLDVFSRVCWKIYGIITNKYGFQMTIFAKPPVTHLRWSLRINFLLHTGQAKFFSPVWVRVCLASSSLLANLFPHPDQLQGKGRSPETFKRILSAVWGAVM